MEEFDGWLLQMIELAKADDLPASYLRDLEEGREILKGSSTLTEFVTKIRSRSTVPSTAPAGMIAPAPR
jgi:hypothetical protein